MLLKKDGVQMDDFGKFCYLDVQKTGSTFISALLKDASALPILFSHKHRYLRSYRFVEWYNLFKRKQFDLMFSRGGFYRPSVIYFNSIRHPFNYYASLYNYGCDKRGGLHSSLNRAGFGGFYDGTQKGFLDWVEFITQPKNGEYMGGGYENGCNRFMGFLTFRFLKLSMVDPFLQLSRITSEKDVQEIYDQKNISTFTIKNENLSKDLLYLFSKHLSPHVNKDHAASFLERQRINASKHKIASSEILENDEAGLLVRKREAFIFNNFYPD